MANNNILFNAALLGAFAGVNTSRSLVSTLSAAYTTQRDNALAFATLLDAGIPAGSFNQQDANLLGSLVQQVWSGKGSAAADATTVNAIITAFNLVRASLLTVSGGGGFTAYPLQSQIDWDTNAQSDTLELVPPGEPDGLYLIMWTLTNLALGSNNLTHTLNYTAPNGAGLQDQEDFGLGIDSVQEVGSGSPMSRVVTVRSTGATAIELFYVTAPDVGQAISIYAQAFLVG